MKKAEFSQILKEINLTKKEFAKLANISYNTVNNWNDENRPIPSWVKSWLENYIKAKDMDTIANMIKPYIKCDEENSEK